MGLNLTVSHLVQWYNGKAALDDCSVAFTHSAVYALMGPNGSGKSTLLRACALLETVDRGEIKYYNSDNAVSLPHDLSLRRRICLVLPKIGVFNTSVFKNVAYGLSVRGLGKKSISQQVYEALDAVGLTHKSKQNALTLSSGETQRLGIARAMVIKPEILFLDEPTASIDEENTRIVEAIIKRLRSSGRTMIILTTHDREQALRLADSIVSMRNGRILSQQQDGPF
ncbi:MAG TPA: ATP-binding cassette domain-containing protein [Nitrospirota bacterium]|nr:ATP-binding cassette domain-containing protein [Nitrospirota bacterium]